MHLNVTLSRSEPVPITCHDPVTPAQRRRVRPVSLRETQLPPSARKSTSPSSFGRGPRSHQPSSTASSSVDCAWVVAQRRFNGAGASFCNPTTLLRRMFRRLKDTPVSSVREDLCKWGRLCWSRRHVTFTAHLQNTQRRTVIHQFVPFRRYDSIRSFTRQCQLYGTRPLVGI